MTTSLLELLIAAKKRPHNNVPENEDEPINENSPKKEDKASSFADDVALYKVSTYSRG